VSFLTFNQRLFLNPLNLTIKKSELNVSGGMFCDLDGNY